MTTYRTIPSPVTAVQWWNHGDYPGIDDDGFFYRWPNSCYVHPGDWIVTHENGTVEHVAQNEFNQRFEEIK